MKEEVKVIELIDTYVNNYFVDGNAVNQAKNYKNLILFMKNNNIPFDMDFEDYNQLLKNQKIINMLKEILNLKDKKTYFENPFFDSLAILYSNDNGIKIDDLDNEKEEDIKVENAKDVHFYNSSLSAYLNSLTDKPYTKEEEKDVFMRYFNGEKSLKNDIIKHNLRLVVSIAKRFVGRGVLLEDIIEEGNIGLMIAVDKFDPRIGNKFSTYASFWIKQSITRNIINYARIIRIPPELFYISLDIDKFQKKFYQENKGQDPSIQEISEAIGVPYEKVKFVMDLTKPVSLNSPVNTDDGQGSELGDFVKDENAINADDIVFNEQLRNIIFNTNILNKQQKTVIAYRFGFIDGKIYTLEEIGNKLNLTRERIRQVEIKALRILRNNWEIKKFNMNNKEERIIKFIL